MYNCIIAIVTVAALCIAPCCMRGQSALQVSAFAYMSALHTAMQVNDSLVGASANSLNVMLRNGSVPLSQLQVWIKDSIGTLLSNINDTSSVPVIKVLPTYESLLRAVRRYRPQYPNEIQVMASAQGTTVNVQQVSTLSSATGVAAPFETQLVNATAQFIADRFKQELALTFFKSLRDSLDSNQVLRRIFPNVRQLLSTLLADPLLLPSLGAAWRNAFETDLKQMPYVATKWMYDDREKVGDTTRGEAIRVAYRAVDLYQRITQGQHVRNILKDYSEKVRQEAENRKQKGQKDSLTSVQESVFILNHILEEIENHRGAWDARQSYQFLQDDHYLKLFVALIAKRYVTKGYDTTVHMPKVDVDTINVSDYRRKLEELISLATSINSTVDELNARSVGGDDASRKRLYYSYVQSAYRLVGFGHNLLSLLNENADTDIFDRYIVPVGELAGQMSMHAGNGDYGAMLGDILRLLNMIRNPESSGIVNGTADTTKGIQLLDSTKHAGILRVASFLMDVVNAKDEKDIQNVLESVAMPAGGYSIKRNSSFAISISSFVGLSAGCESSRDIATGVFSDKRDYFLQPSALLGVDISAACGKTAKLGGSIFIGFVDLGALVSYRITQSNDSLQSTPNVGIRQVFSPTVMVTLAPGDTPICLGLGLQLAPMLRSVTTTGATFREVDAFRQFFTITCDLTLFNILAMR